jgi:LRP1 type putative zinc finger protein
VASSGRRLSSVSAAYADWIAAAGGDDLSLGFNAAAASAAGLWGTPASRQPLNYGIAAAGDVGMVVVAPTASFHHHQHQQQHQRAAAAAAAADGRGGDHPGFALLSAGQCAALEDQAKSGSAIQFWQAHSQPTTPPAAAAGAHKKPAPAIDYGGGGSSGSGGSTTCNDCGNQAKKDCPHQRCRTCCKSRGFDCTTHVRSTWIPAARRREKQQQPAGDGNLSPPATAASKKPRLLSSQTTTATTSTSNGTSSSQQGDQSAQTTTHIATRIIQQTRARIHPFDSLSADAPFRDSLPRQLRAPAVFRCVRVTSVEDGEAEFAYQAAVCINGHLFKGFLYDQGADEGRSGNDDHASGQAHAAAVRSISDLHLGSASAVPPDMYNTVSGALILGGLGYGNTMN